MKVIPITQLIIPDNRQRREFDEKRIQELADSINSKGLFHPPVVRETADGFILVAGERRTRAIKSLHLLDIGITCNGEDLPCGTIPVTLLSDLSPLAIREAELEENTIRVDLSWQEQAAATAELHALRNEQATIAAASPQTISATASEILGRPAKGSEISRVSEAIVLAKHLDDPEVAAAKSQKEALKVVRKKAEARKREELAQAFDQASSPHECILGDSLTELCNLPSDTYACIITDPPYGVGADTFGDMASTGHKYEDTPDYAMSCYSQLATQGYRIAKPQAHAYVFCDIRMFSSIALEFSIAGWDVWPTPMIWAKSNGMLPKPEFGPRKTYEAILFATKGKKPVLKVGQPDVISIPQTEKLLHGAQKPVEVYLDLLSRSCYPGDLIIDPFCGSGTVFDAANRAKYTATGIELNPEYYNISLSRMSAIDALGEFGL